MDNRPQVVEPNLSNNQTSEPVGPDTAPTAGPEPNYQAPVAKSSKKTPKLLIPIVALVALLLGGGAYAYLNIYQQNPDNVWKDSMRNTAEGLKNFSAVDKLGSMEGTKYSGSLNVDKPTAVTANFEGKSKGNNSELNGTVSVSGAKLDLAARTLGVEGADYPDVYFKVNGIRSATGMMAQEQASQLEQFEDKWLFVDHTLLTQAAQNASGDESLGAANINFTEDDIRNMRSKVAGVMEQYVFTNDESKSIVKRTGDPVKEDFDGQASYKFPVEIQKDNVKAFATAMKDALKETKLKELVAPGDKSFEEAIKFDQLIEDIEKSDPSKVKVEVWADKTRRFVRNVRITPPEEEGDSGHIDMGLNYKGGDEYPFYLRLDAKEDNNPFKLNFNLTSNRADNSVKVSADGDFAGDNAAVFRFNMNITPSSDDVEPAMPEGAINVAELFGQFQQSVERQNDELMQLQLDDQQL